MREHYEVDLNWPSPETQLSKHMATGGLRAETSHAGRLAQTLIGRLGGRPELDVLALPNGLGILEALVVRRSKKIAQHVRKELQNAGMADIDEDVVAEVLRKEGLFAELEVKTLTEMQGSVGLPRGPMLQTLAPLCEAGHVQRGRSMTCPFCETRDFWRLAELNDTVTCRACLQEFPLPAIEDGEEPPTAYRLDGLIARAMGQDILPVLVTLRYFLNRPESRGGGHWWPGLDLYDGCSTDADQEIDLLYAEAGIVWVCEVKRSASGLPIKQAEKLCSVASRLNATPVFSAPLGDWGPEIVELAEREGALLLDGSVLIELPEAPEEKSG